VRAGRDGLADGARPTECPLPEAGSHECICYVITLAVQVPFLDQLFYVGPLVKPLGGADISWIVGFGVASLLYLAGAKRSGAARALPATAGSAS
jgi:hypothetical protein